MYNTDFPTRAELPSARKLLRSTAVALIVATGLLITTVLPAEYGIDPTGIGRMLGLTQMGEIKQSLAAEAKNEKSAVVASVQPTPAVLPIEKKLAQPAPANEHTMTVTLKPDQGAEIKLAMREDSRVNFEWTAVGGPVNFDAHGDPVNAPKGFYHGYGKGRNETSNKGTLQAAFDGKHGWFWRNRSGTEVTITLKTSGEYEKIERVI
jgi:hypothetical protein